MLNRFVVSMPSLITG